MIAEAEFAFEPGQVTSGTYVAEDKWELGIFDMGKGWVLDA